MCKSVEAVLETPTTTLQNQKESCPECKTEGKVKMMVKGLGLVLAQCGNCAGTGYINDPSACKKMQRERKYNCWCLRMFMR